MIPTMGEGGWGAVVTVKMRVRVEGEDEGKGEGEDKGEGKSDHVRTYIREFQKLQNVRSSTTEARLTLILQP